MRVLVGLVVALVATAAPATPATAAASSPLPPRPLVPASDFLRVSSWSNHTYHHGIGDSWPCTSVSDPAGDMVCIAGDIKTAGFADCITSGLSAWHVKGMPSPKTGFFGAWVLQCRQDERQNQIFGGMGSL